MFASKQSVGTADDDIDLGPRTLFEADLEKAKEKQVLEQLTEKYKPEIEAGLRELETRYAEVVPEGFESDEDTILETDVVGA